MARTSATAAGSSPSILGIAVVEDHVASVVRSADGEVIASNRIDLPDSSAQSAESAIDDLVESVPYEIDRIGIACNRPATERFLQAALTPGASRPAWCEKVRVADLPTALAEVARTEMGARGIIAAIDLDRDAVPSAGSSVVILDSATGEVLGTAEFAYGTPGPVTDPSNATEVADAMTSAPNGSSVTSVVCTGPGAEAPGVAEALEYALARPVTVLDDPALAPAVGAAMVATRPVTASSGLSRRSWWLIAAAVVGALAVGALATAAFAVGAGTEREAAPTTVTVTETPKAVTVVRTPRPVTRTETERVTVSPDRAERETVTRSATVTKTVTEAGPPPPTVTVTVTQTFPGAPPSGGYAP